MPSVNNCTLIGHLGKDPVESDSRDMTISRFSLAVSRARKREGQPDTDWFSVTAFGKTADFCNQYLRKGNMVCVCGSVQLDTFTGRDGGEMKAMSIVANSVQSLERKESGDREEPRRSRERDDDRPAQREEPKRKARDYDDDGSEDPFAE